MVISCLSFIQQRYDGATAISSVDTASHGAAVNTVKWSPNGKNLLAVGQASGGNEIRIFSFDGSDLTSVATGSLPGGTAHSGDWSLSGQYLVVSGETTGDDTVIFDVANVPVRCVIKNNDVSNTTGGLCGIGIEGASARNLIIKNTGYENDTNFSRGIFNKFIEGLNSTPDNDLDNVSVPPYDI